MSNEEKKAEILRIHALAQAGYAGTLSNGNIVDRREHPEALPLQKNSLLGVPEPKPTADDTPAEVRRSSY